jgi:hypothetical protein
MRIVIAILSLFNYIPGYSQFVPGIVAQGIMDPGCPNNVTDTNTYVNSEMEDILDYATANNYCKPTLLQRMQQDSLITDLKFSGYWTEMDVFYVFATNGDSMYASINWINPGTPQGAFVGDMIHKPNMGVMLDNSPGYYETNFNPGDGGTYNYTQNDAGRFIWVFSGDIGGTGFGNLVGSSVAQAGPNGDNRLNGVTVTGNAINGKVEATDPISINMAITDADTLGFAGLVIDPGNTSTYSYYANFQFATFPAPTGTLMLQNYTDAIFLYNGLNYNTKRTVSFYGAGANFITEHADLRAALNDYILKL